MLRPRQICIDNLGPSISMVANLPFCGQITRFDLFILFLVLKNVWLLALFWLFYQEAGMIFFGIDVCVIKYERRNLNDKATREVVKLSFGARVYA